MTGVQTGTSGQNLATREMRRRSLAVRPIQRSGRPCLTRKLGNENAGLKPSAKENFAALKKLVSKATVPSVRSGRCDSLIHPIRKFYRGIRVLSSTMLCGKPVAQKGPMRDRTSHWARKQKEVLCGLFQLAH